MILYEDILKRCKNVPEKMICLDPGNTTGWAFFFKGNLVHYGQIPTVHDNHDILWENILNLLLTENPDLVVCENYRIYAHKLERHTYSEVPTLRLIGGIDMYCHIQKIPIEYQMASQHKGLITDQKLKAWGFWKKDMKHARDAIRVGLYRTITKK